MCQETAGKRSTFEAFLPTTVAQPRGPRNLPRRSDPVCELMMAATFQAARCGRHLSALGLLTSRQAREKKGHREEGSRDSEKEVGRTFGRSKEGSGEPKEEVNSSANHETQIELALQERGGAVSLQDAAYNARQAKNLASQVEEQRLGQVLTHLAKAIEELAKALQAQR